MIKSDADTYSRGAYLAITKYVLDLPIDRL